MKNALTWMMVGGVLVGVIIWYVTGAVWQAIPIGLGLWVGKIAQRALETDAEAAPAAPPKKGAKK